MHHYFVTHISTLCFLNRALWYYYITKTYRIQTLHINILIEFLASPTCFVHHVFITRKTICTCSFYVMFFMHLCKHRLDCLLKCMKNITYKLHVQMVFLVMNTRCSQHAGDAKNSIKILMWKVCILLVFITQ